MHLDATPVVVKQGNFVQLLSALKDVLAWLYQLTASTLSQSGDARIVIKS